MWCLFLGKTRCGNVLLSVLEKENSINGIGLVNIQDLRSWLNLSTIAFLPNREMIVNMS